MFRRFAWLSFGFLLGVTACGPSCKSVCDDQNDCPNQPRENCADYCRHEEREAHDKDCSEKLDAYFDCLGGLDDICALDLSRDCTSESKALDACEAAK